MITTHKIVRYVSHWYCTRWRRHLCQGTTYCKCLLLLFYISDQNFPNTFQPAIQKCSDLSLKAIFSRSLSSAQATASLLPSSHSPVDLYSADAGAGKTYHDLLLREDIAGVIIVLPITSQPEYIEAALAAGKHVLAEKPIAKDLASAKKLISFYEKTKSEGKSGTFSVAENFRFVPKFLFAAEEAKKLGRVTHFNIKVMSWMKSSSKYFQTSWREKPEYQGGFLLDGGIHHAAGARLFLQGEQNKPHSVQAISDQVQENLPPIDSINAIIKTTSGASGVFQHSQGTTMNAFEFDFAFEKGSVKICEDIVTITPVDGETVTKSFPRSSGVGEEVQAWANGLSSGSMDEMQSCHQGLQDLEFMELMFQSGEQDGKKMVYELQ